MPQQMINFNQQTTFKVQTTETLTIPDTVTAASPTGASSGINPTTAFDAKRATVGGQVVFAFSDVAGPAQVQDDFQYRLQPGDVLAVGAIGGGKANVTVNGTVVFVITATAVCGVLGYYA